MNKTVIGVVAILAVACLVGLYIWSSYNRFYIMTSSQGIAYEVDRKTGESWMLRGERKVPQQGGSNKRHREEQLPFSDASKITGSAGLNFGHFSGKLYNGSDWTVSRVVISVAALENAGTVRWSRDFSESITIKPLTTGSFSISVSDEHGITNSPWSIKQAFGYKE